MITRNSIFDSLIERIEIYYVAGLLTKENNEEFFTTNKHFMYSIHLAENRIVNEFLNLKVDQFGNITFEIKCSPSEFSFSRFPFENELLIIELGKERNFTRCHVYGDSEGVFLKTRKEDKDAVIQIIDWCLPYLF